MGITIFYKGSMNNPLSYDHFIEELVDICKDMHWKYQLWEEDLNLPNTAHIEVILGETVIKGHLPLRGLSIGIHPQSDPLSFLFDKESNIRNMLSMVSGIDNKMEERTYTAVKTQYAPIEVHITIIKLLKYLKKKYFSDLEVIDEGEYWDKEDENVLFEKRKFLEDKLEEVASVIQKIKTSTVEDTENLIQRFEETIKKYFNFD